MKPSHILLNALCALFWLSISTITYAALEKAKIRIGQPGPWVEQHNTSTHLPPAAAHSASVFHNLLETQIYFDGEQSHHFQRVHMQVNNSAGLNQASEIKIGFVPDYQRFTLHKISIIRGAKTLDLTRKAQKRIVDTENQFQQSLLHGASAALLIVPDVRVGDRIEYSYSISGSNPVFNGYFFTHQRTVWPVPIGQSIISIKAPSKTPLHLKHADDNAPLTTHKNGYTLHLWTVSQLPAHPVHEGTTPWHMAEPTISASSFANWEAVAQWGDQLFPRSPHLSHPELKQLVRDLKAIPSKARQVEKALEYAQQKVRYFGIEVGENSHRPHLPDTVAERGYGDCKDKTLLLISLLRPLGIQAYPALVHSRLGENIGTQLPSPAWFDHVITKIDLGDRTYWVDPTNSYERGTLAVRAAEEHHQALVLHAGTRALTQMPRQTLETPNVSIREKVALGLAQNSSIMTIDTQYRGHYANYMRARILTHGLAQLERDIANHQRQLYPKSKSTRSLTYHDDKTRNLITLSSQFNVPSFIKYKEDRYTYTLYEHGMRDFLPSPASLPDNIPMALGKRVYVEHLRSYLLPFRHSPGDLNKRVRSQALNGPSVSLRIEESKIGRIHNYLSSLKIEKNSLPIEEVEGYRDFYEKYSQGYAHEFFYHTNLDNKALGSSVQTLKQRLSTYTSEQQP